MRRRNLSRNTDASTCAGWCATGSSTGGVTKQTATLLYGSGLRVSECCQLRVRDVDFDSNQIVVRRGKGDKDRVTMLPRFIQLSLQRHLVGVREQHERNIRAEAGWVELPHAYAHKSPTAGQQWCWQWVFPATRGYFHQASGHTRRHHLHQTVLQHDERRAVLASDIPIRAFSHTFRHSPARRRHGHPHPAEAHGPQGHSHHHDLHARAQSRPRWSHQSCRPAAGNRPIPRAIKKSIAAQKLWCLNSRSRLAGE